MELEAHADTITGLALSPDGHHLLSNSMDSQLRCWDVRPFVAGGPDSAAQRVRPPSSSPISLSPPSPPSRCSLPTLYTFEFNHHSPATINIFIAHPLYNASSSSSSSSLYLPSPHLSPSICSLVC